MFFRSLITHQLTLLKVVETFVFLLFMVLVLPEIKSGVADNAVSLQAIDELVAFSPLQLLNCRPLGSVVEASDVASSPNPLTTATASLPQGLALWITHRPNDARRVWTQVHAKNSTNVSAGIWLGLSSLCLGMDTSATEVFDQFSGADTFFVIIANLNREKGNVELSRFWMKAAAMLSQDLPGIYTAATKYQQEGRVSEAVALLRDYADVLPHDSPYRWRALGMAERFAGNIQEANRYFGQGLRIDPNDLWLLSQVRVAKIDAGDLDGALDVLMQEIELDGGQQWLHLVAAQIYRGKGDLDNALLWANREQQAFPNHWASYDELGSIECAAGNYEVGLNFFDKAMSFGTVSPVIAIHRATCLHDMSQFDAAIVYAEEVISRYSGEPALIDLYLSLGSWYIERGEVERACNLYDRGLAHWPEAHWLSERLGAISSRCPVHNDGSGS